MPPGPFSAASRLFTRLRLANRRLQRERDLLRDDVRIAQPDDLPPEDEPQHRSPFRGGLGRFAGESPEAYKDAADLAVLRSVEVASEDGDAHTALVWIDLARPDPEVRFLQPAPESTRLPICTRKVPQGPDRAPPA